MAYQAEPWLSVVDDGVVLVVDTSYYAGLKWVNKQYTLTPEVAGIIVSHDAECDQFALAGGARSVRVEEVVAKTPDQGVKDVLVKANAAVKGPSAEGSL